MTAPIVVGVDGSQASARALQWAVQEARRIGAPVRAVHAWWVPPEYSDAGLTFASPERAEAHQQAGEELIQGMLAEVTAPDVDVATEVVNDHPATALIDRSESADRLVVSTRGLGGFKALLLGSVSQQVVQHARCPVVVIPPVA